MGKSSEKRAGKKAREKSKDPSRSGRTGRDEAVDAEAGREGLPRPYNRPGSKNPERRCTATANRTGERCRAPAIKGGTVCRIHGGAAKQVKESARDRLLALTEPALVALKKVLTDPNAEDSVKVRAAVAILDRTGHGPGQTITIETTPWDHLINDLDEGALEIDRALPTGGGDLGIDEDQQAWGRAFASEDLRSRNRRALADADEPLRIDPDENTIRGEVVISDE